MFLIGEAIIKNVIICVNASNWIYPALFGYNKKSFSVQLRLKLNKIMYQLDMICKGQRYFLARVRGGATISRMSNSKFFDNFAYSSRRQIGGF